MAAQRTFWEKTKNGGRLGFDRLYGLVDKLGPPVNKLSNRLGSEAFWPTSMDKECDKAARILRSFCKDGFYDEEEQQSAQGGGPTQKQKVLKKIPAEVIQNAHGLAIFTTLRTGLWLSGSGGSGVLVSRTADGNWSSPSGIQVQTMGLGFLMGVDIYDCVLVINTQKALEAFTRFRCTLGGDLSATAGPFGMGAVLETELHKRQAPVFTYLKSRGFYAGVQIDGTVVIERDDENERFYGQRITAQDILKGKVRHAPLECRGLYETLKSAQGDADFDTNLVPSDPPPSDFEIVQEGQTFGVPAKDDPDPYGVLQLEKEGMLIREAATKERASWEQFMFSPTLKSPAFDTSDRRSIFSGSATDSRRSSYMQSTHANGHPLHIQVASERRLSKESVKTPVSMSDMATQTDDLPPPPSPSRRSIRASSIGSKRTSSMEHIPEHEVLPTSPSVHSRPSSHIGRQYSDRSATSPPSTPPTKMPVSEKEIVDKEATPVPEDQDIDGEIDLDDLDSDDEVVEFIDQPVVHSVRKAPAPIVLQARMVTVPKRGPPPTLPTRNPNRHSGPLVIDGTRPTSQSSLTNTLPASPEEEPASHSTPASFEYSKAPPSPAHDSAHASVNDTHDEISPEPTPEETPNSISDPWSGVLAKHSSINTSQVSLEMPGAFHSFPTTPIEEEV